MASTPIIDGMWWREPRDRVHDALCALVRYLVETPEEKARRGDLLDHARLYSAKFFRGFLPTQYARVETVPDDRKLSANVCRAVVDAATAKIAKNRPRAVLITNGGDWFEKNRAKKATRAIEGAFQSVELYDLGPTVFRDAAIFGTGVIKWHARGRKIVADRVMPHELLVDSVDAMYGRPRCLYQTKVVDKSVLLAMYGRSPKARAAIERAAEQGSNAQPIATYGRANVAQPIEVIEGWHLPSGPDAGDGVHVIAIDGYTLRHEAWERDDFPFTFYRWSEPVTGFWGQGLVEAIRPLQREINHLLRRIQEILHLCAVPRVFVEAGSIVKSMITNQPGGIVPYKPGSNPPVFANAPTVPPELFVHLRFLISQAFELPGISQLSAQSKKPAGLDSGRALREFNDIETERFAIPARAYETMFMRSARQVIALARQMEAAGESWTVVHFDRRAKAAAKLTWADVAMDEDSYTLQVLPTSALPRDMAGRMATVEQMIGAGFISLERGKQLLDFPDLDASNDLELAAFELVEKQVATMLDPDVDVDEAYQPPEPYSNLEYARSFAQLAHDRERLEGAPEERLAMLRDYIDAADALIERAAQAQAANAAAQASAGPGATVTPISAAPGGAAPSPVPANAQAA
jgi:hypothetical protein